VIRFARGLRQLLVGPSAGRSRAEDGPYETWTAAAAACGVENLVSKRQFFVGPWRFEGARPPLTVTITCIASRPPTAVITLRGVPGHVRLKHESLRTYASKLMGVRETILGDPEFDDTFFVEGEPFALHALFVAGSRLEPPPRRS
jgi:hypothetical protein